MSRPDNPIRQCQRCGKRTHLDQESAFAAALRLSGRFGRPYRAYECPHGAGWHLTTKPLREHTAGGQR